MVFGRRGFGVEMVILFLFMIRGLVVLDCFDTGFNIASGFIVFGLFFILRYNGVISSSCRDLLRQAIT
jgi:hypothetical protein